MGDKRVCTEKAFQAPFKAIIFDLDGVISQTATIHKNVWARMFNDFLAKRKNSTSSGTQIQDDSSGIDIETREFTVQDYLKYVDGRPRYEGVGQFLKSRGIQLLYGDPSDDPTKDTICGLGNRKQIMFRKELESQSVESYPSTVQFVQNLKKQCPNVKIAVASSSKNCKLILDKLNILSLFDVIVDGNTIAERKWKGKPHPEMFLKTLEMLSACDQQIKPWQCIIVEDATSGVEAGKAGHFGLVLGVDRGGNAHSLLQHGADVVISDFSELCTRQLATTFSTVLPMKKIET